MARRKPELFVGVDVGGTNIGAALVASSGDIRARHRNRTPRTGKAKDSLAAILGTIEELIETAGVASRDLAAIGLGIAGIVDSEAGRMLMSSNTGLGGQDIVGPVTDKFGVPAALGNDVDVGTLGETWLGAARGAKSVVGVFVGTGIGGGIVLDGRLVRGSRFVAAEIGHVVIDMGGPKCVCGVRGCLEAIASRSAIERDIREAVAKKRKTIITDILDGDLARIRSGALKKALRKGDDVVTEVIARASEALGWACVSVRHMLDPDVIVLGGGVMEACADFMMPAIHAVAAQDPIAGAEGRDGGRIVLSALGDDANVLGAVALAHEAIGRALDADARPPAPDYPALEAPGLGTVKVGDEVYEKDVVVRADGSVRRRKKTDGGPHKVTADDVARSLKGRPMQVFVGIGYDEAAEVTDEAEQHLRERGIACVVASTPEACRLFNEALGAKAALLHVTC